MYLAWVSLENVAEFRCLGVPQRNQNDMNQEIKSRLNSQNLLSKSVKIKIHRTTVFPVVLYGCETQFLALSEEHRLSMMLREILGHKMEEVALDWRNFHKWELHDKYCSPNRGRDSSVGIATSYGLDGSGMESRWEARFSAPVWTGPGTHPASYTMGTASFSGVKQLVCGVDHPPPSSTEVEGGVELYICTFSGPLWPVLG